MTSLAKIPEYQPILDAIAEGMTTTDACALHGVSPQTFKSARRSHPDLQTAYVQAQELGAEAQADTLFNLHKSIRDPLMARVVSDNRKWLLSKRQAATYGDKLQVETQHNADLAIILKEAIARIPRPGNDQPLTIDAKSVTISDIFGD